MPKTVLANEGKVLHDAVVEKHRIIKENEDCKNLLEVQTKKLDELIETQMVKSACAKAGFTLQNSTATGKIITSLEGIKKRLEKADKDLAQIPSPWGPLADQIARSRRDDLHEQADLSSMRPPGEELFSLAKRLFFHLTGKQLPDKVATQLRDLPNRTQGQHCWRTNTIQVEPSSFPYALLVAMHELGHVVAQHQEREDQTNLLYQRKRKITQGARVLEEACAYAFSWAGAMVAPASINNTMVFLLREHAMGWMKSYALGSRDEHAEGMLLADAAITHFKSASKAFNYLATTPPEDINSSISFLMGTFVGDFRDATRLALEPPSHIIKEVDKQTSKLAPFIKAA